MKTFKRFAGLAGLAMMLGMANPAHAAWMFQIERVSDSFGLLTGTGQADGPGNGIAFDLLVGNTTGSDQLGILALNSFALGGASPTEFNINPAGSVLLDWGTGTAYNAGDTFTGGPLEITLPSGVSWLPVGSTDEAVDGSTGGTWEIVAAAPVPGALWLLGGGLAGLLVVRRRRPRTV